MSKNSITTAAIITAAGSGSRLGYDMPKAIVPLAGIPLVARATIQLLRSGQIGTVVVTAPANQVAEMASIVRRYTAGAGFSMPITVVPGGETRQESVWAGIEVILDLKDAGEQIERVLVHDAARPLVPSDVVTRVVIALNGGAKAVIPTLPVVDTIKVVQAADNTNTRTNNLDIDKLGPKDQNSEDSKLRTILNVSDMPKVERTDIELVEATLPRPLIRAVQTPQGFELETLVKAHRLVQTQLIQDKIQKPSSSRGINGPKINLNAASITDDASLVEILETKVFSVLGDPLAFKITTAPDLQWAEFLLNNKLNMEKKDRES